MGILKAIQLRRSSQKHDANNVSKHSQSIISAEAISEQPNEEIFAQLRAKNEQTQKQMQAQMDLIAGLIKEQKNMKELFIKLQTQQKPKPQCTCKCYCGLKE